MCFPRNICVARVIKERTQYLEAKTVTRRTLKVIYFGILFSGVLGLQSSHQMV